MEEVFPVWLDWEQWDSLMVLYGSYWVHGAGQSGAADGTSATRLVGELGKLIHPSNKHAADLWIFNFKCLNC